MRSSIVFGGLLALIFGLASFGSHATGNAPELSYSSHVSTKQLTKTIEGLSAWARGELAEHEDEGLFETRKDEHAIISKSIEFAEKLLAQAQEAEAKGDLVTARTYFYAAEAVARYAALMPHLLEDRLAERD